MVLLESSELHPNNTQDLLERLEDWRKGICPNGTLANQACFVLEAMPKITMLYSNSDDYVTTEVVSESLWTENLIESGAITTMNDDSLIQSLSNFYMMFHSYHKEIPTQYTLHSTHIDKHAVFNVDRIMRPTEHLRDLMHEILIQVDTSTQWSLLLHLWNQFGYFWPRKIILGYKQHLSKSYTSKTEAESTSGFYSTLNTLKAQHKIKEESKKNMHYEFLSHCEIVARLDLTPLHEFFDDPYRSLIQSLIQTKFMHVLSNKPIQIFNVATNSFLCWDPITNKKSNEKDHHFLVRSIPKEHLKETTSKQCLWKINWSPFAEKYTPADILNGSSRIYIQPAEIPETHHALMILSCRPAQYDEMTPKQLHFSRIKALRLLLPDTTQYEKSSWSLEYPNNQLKYVTDYQLNIKLNINEHIRRIKPLLEGDEIQFQQVGLLTAFYPVEKSGSGADPQSVKNTKSRNNVLCIDEDIIHERYAKNTIWKIQLPPHHSQPIVSHPRVFRFEDLTKGESRSHTSFVSDVQPTVSSINERRLRRVQSFSSIESGLSRHTNKAPYFENLVTGKMTTKLMSQFVKKVTLDPIAQLVKTQRTKQINKSHPMSP